MPMVITTCVLFSPRPCASSADARFSSTCPLISLPAKTRAFSDLKSLHTLWLDSLFLLLPRGGNCVYDWLHLLSNLFTCFCRRKSATWNKNHGTEFSIRTYSFQRTSIVYLIYILPCLSLKLVLSMQIDNHAQKLLRMNWSKDDRTREGYISHKRVEVEWWIWYQHPSEKSYLKLKQPRLWIPLHLKAPDRQTDKWDIMTNSV